MRKKTFLLAIMLSLPLVFAVTPVNPGDLNNDNSVNVNDVLLVMSCLGQNGASCGVGRADPNNDNQVNIFDFVYVAQSWGRTYTPTTPASGPVVAYNFDQSSGTTLNDISGNGNTLTLNGDMEWYASGRNGRAIRFPSGPSYLRGANTATNNIGNPITIMFWANAESTFWDPLVVSKPWTTGSLATPRYQWGIDYAGNANYRFYFGDTTNTLRGPYSLPVAIGAWHHIAYTFDGTTVRGYVDGVQQLSTAITATIATRGNEFNLGVDTTNDKTFKGLLDDLRIYNRVLTQAEIQSDMNTAVSSTPSVCGNGIVEGSEQCDGSNLNGQTCTSRGFIGGTLSCSGSCTFNTAACQSDTTAPSVSITAPTTGSTITTTTTVTATASDNIAVQSVQFLINGNNLGSADTSSPYSVSLNPASYTNGAYTLTARATDTNSNIATSSGVSITITNPPDTTPPTVTITAPSAGQTLSYGTTSTTLSVTTNEAATCRWSTTDVTYASMTNTFSTTGGTSHSTTLTGLTNGGSYTRYVRCQDVAGNPTTTSQSRSFSVSNTPPSGNSEFWNSAEPGCNGSNPNYLLCDGFDDGTAVPTSNGLANPENDGWAMTWWQYAGDNSDCTLGVASSCSLRATLIGGSDGGGNNIVAATHALYGDPQLPAIRQRWYVRYSNGYDFNGNQKFVSGQQDAHGGGIQFYGIGADLDRMYMLPVYDGNIQDYPNPQTNAGPNGLGGKFCRNGPDGEGCAYLGQNVNPMGLTTGRWYYMETRFVLNTPGQRNGVYQMWLNDCGTNGVCTGSPTLRANYNNIQFRGPGDNSQINGFYLDIWGNPADGGSVFVDQLIVARDENGMIGFAQ